MQFDHVMTAGLVVQGVDVLGDQAADPPGALQAGEGVVGHVRLCLTHPRPAQHRSRPVTPPGFGRREKFLVHHRLAAAPHALVVAIVGNARRRADAGAGQDRERLVGHQVLEAIELFVDLVVEHLQHSGGHGRTHVGAAAGCDLLILLFNIKIKRSQPAAAPTGCGRVTCVLPGSG
ncbi:hypothetical protein D3C81_1717330 [compost metagenome]